jgi:protein involved in polysaccharide export with SLBB domain
MIQSRRWTTWGLALLGAVSGCSSGPGGNRFTPFPEGHRLIEPAREARVVADGPDVPRELAKVLHPPWIVEPGDVLLAQPANLDSPVRLPGDQTVLPDGSIKLGRYGRVVVAGKTVEQIEADVNALVQSQTRDAGPIIVRLVTRDSKVYYVLGEVNAPGSFQLKGRECVLDAILAAGGLTSGASRRNIILSRPTPPHGERVVLAVCYNHIVQLGDTTTNYQIKAGDRVYVSSRNCWDDLHCLFKGDCGPCGSDHHGGGYHGERAPALWKPTPGQVLDLIGPPVTVPAPAAPPASLPIPTPVPDSGPPPQPPGLGPAGAPAAGTIR